MALCYDWPYPHLAATTIILSAADMLRNTLTGLFESFCSSLHFEIFSPLTKDPTLFDMHRKILFPQIFTLCLLSCFLTGCNLNSKSYSRAGDKGLATEPSVDKFSRKQDPKPVADVTAPPEEKVLLVLLPGLGKDDTEYYKEVLEEIRSALEERNKGDKTYITLFCDITEREKNTLPIIKQAQKVTQQIIEKLAEHPDESKNIKMVFLGYSQGAPRGIMALRELRKKNYENEVRFYSLAGPLGGSIIVGGGTLARVLRGKGATSLKPNGSFIKKYLKDRLYECLEDKKLSMVLIGGKSSFKKFDENGKKIKYGGMSPARVSRGCLHNQTMIRSFTNFFGKQAKHCTDAFTFSPLLLPGPLLSPTLTRGHSKRKMPEGPPIKSVREHDSVVSLASQLARNVLPEQLPDNWERVAVEGCHHGSFGEDFVTGKPILEHPEVRKKVVKGVLKWLKDLQPDTEDTRP